MSKKVDWNALRAEYIGGGISQRKLAAKYGVSADFLMQKANREHWGKDREAAVSKAIELAQQKTAEAASDNAVTAQRIRTKLLKKLEKEIDELPDSIGSETRQSIIENQFDGKGNRIKKSSEVSKAYRLIELATAFEKLTKDMNIGGDADGVRIIIDV